MKKLRIREILLGLTCAVVGATLTVACIREPALKTGFWAFVCWLGFFEMIYTMFLAPEEGERQLLRVQKIQELYRQRFGVFGPIMGYTPVLTMFAGLALTWLVTENIELRLLIILLTLAAAAAEALWLRSWLDDAMREFDKENR